MIRKSITNETHFLILTETKTPIQKFKYKKMKYRLQPTLISGKETCQTGVAIYSHPSYQLIHTSSRFSSNPGHFACGIYDNHGSKVLVGAVYGEPSQADQQSAAIFKELNDTLSELTALYEINNIILAGDFNITFQPSDTTSSINTYVNRKLRAKQVLYNLLERFQLVDAAKILKRMYTRGIQHHHGHSLPELITHLLVKTIPIWSLNNQLQYSIMTCYQ